MVNTNYRFSKRDGVFPKWFAVTHKKYKTPYRAVMLVSMIALIVSFALSFPFGPFDAAIITGAMAGIQQRQRPKARNWDI